MMPPVPGMIRAGDVIERIWAIYVREAPLLLPAAVVLYGVQFVVSLLAPESVLLLVTVLFWVLAVLYQGFVVEIVAADQTGRRIGSQGELVRAVTPALGPLLAISILFGIGIFIGFVLIIVPGLILLTFWSVVVPVEVLERPGVFGSFGRSRELVRGNGWSVFGVIVLVYVAVLVVSFLAALVAAPLGHFGRDLVQWAVNVALAPVIAISASVLYFALLAARGQRLEPVGTPGDGQLG